MGAGSSKVDSIETQTSPSAVTQTPANVGSTVAPTTAKRRIVKAVKPTKVETTTYPGNDPSAAADFDKEEKEDSPAARHGVTVKIQPKTKAKREAKLQQHRLAEKATQNAQTNESSEPKPLANPMSKFLSAFSVQPKHWEHKRRMSEDFDPDQPLEKRLRADTPPMEDETKQSNKLTAVAALVGTLAIATALVVWRRFKA